MSKHYTKLRKQQQQRRERIMKLHREGKTKAEIGRRLKVSRQRISQIVAAEERAVTDSTDPAKA